MLYPADFSAGYFFISKIVFSYEKRKGTSDLPRSKKGRKTFVVADYKKGKEECLAIISIE